MSAANKENQEKRPCFYQEFADQIIKALEEGTAPWIKPWKPGEFVAPFNPVSGRQYTGSNFVRLAMEQLATGREDPRFVTFIQAKGEDWTVRNGAKGRAIVYYQFEKNVPVLDENGNQVLDEKGKPLKEKVQLESPMACYSHVFHASQVDGMPEWKRDLSAPKWDPVERAEKILANSGAKILHDQRDGARYRHSSDSIHLPPKKRFENAHDYYATAMHELAHWTGGKERLNRESGSFGTEKYAKEELRAEIASWMICSELGIGHNPDGQHTSYVTAWVEILKKDPDEIQRACRDAEKIKQYCLGFELQQNLDKQPVQEQEQQADATKKVEPAPAPQEPKRVEDVREAARSSPPVQAAHVATMKTYLHVPYDERMAAKDLGARWDVEAKLWYAPAGTDLRPLQPWTAENQQKLRDEARPAMSPEQEFAEALREYGLDLKGQMPIMDGKMHRVPLLDGKDNSRDGGYRGYLDGRPAGFIQNYKSGESGNWKYSGGHRLSKEQVEARKIEALQRREDAEKERRETQTRAAKRAFSFWNDKDAVKWAKNDQRYLAAKKVQSFGVKEDAHGNLIVPGRDADGFMHTLQTITPYCKRFEAGGRKSGCFHLIDPDKKIETSPLLIAEGYATAASIHMATGLPCAAAFDAGNLLPVAKALREKYPDKPIVIVADNDHGLENNPGLTKAAMAAEAVNGKMVCPEFNEEEKAKGLTDFNDLHVSRGLVEVNRHLFEAVQNALTEDQVKQTKVEHAQSQGMSM